MMLSKKNFISRLSAVYTKIESYIPPLLLLLYALLYFFYSWFSYALASFYFDTFDTALKVLSHYYIRAGLVPYRDFGVIYPPGIFLLVGKLIPFTSIVQCYFILSLFRLAIVSLGVFFLFLLNRGWANVKRLMIGISFYLLFIVLALNLTYDLLMLPLLGILVLSVCGYLACPKKKGWFFLVTLFIGNGAIVFLRWDPPLGLLLVQGAIFFILLVLKIVLKEDEKMGRLVLLMLAQVFGFLTGMLLLFWYLNSQHALKSGIDFIFKIPFFILPYKKLPLQPLGFVSLGFNLLYVTFAVLLSSACFVLRLFLKEKKIEQKFLLLFLILMPTAVLPYALGRADFTHACPFFFLVGISLIVLYSRFIRQPWFTVLFVALLVPHFLFLDPNYWVTRLEVDWLSRTAREFNADCQQKVAGIKSYRSLFVGRMSYRRYIVSKVNLYFINTKVPPATAFISDEAGVQNSCYYGKKITEQLESAPKPMLAFLELGMGSSEPNATATMHSCGVIENFLQKNPHQDIGVCHSRGSNFLIRLYNPKNGS